MPDSIGLPRQSCITPTELAGWLRAGKGLLAPETELAWGTLVFMARISQRSIPNVKITFFLDGKIVR